MRSDNYSQYFSAANLMGPNSIRLLDEMLETHPLHLTKDQLVLDLGCGTGLSSLFIANETGATVYANDLWISKEDNRKRFEQWHMQDRLIPMQEDATNHSFGEGMFDAIISIDSYHYFGGKEGFFADKLLPCLKSGGVALIVVPGMKNAYDGQSKPLLGHWLGGESHMFQSAAYWKRILGEHEQMTSVETWEMNAFEQPWQEWFATGHEFALNDQKIYESHLKPYTTFVGMKVQKR